MLPATYMASSLSPSRGVTGGGGGVGDSNSESDLDEEESHDEMKPQAESSNFDSTTSFSSSFDLMNHVSKKKKIRFQGKESQEKRKKITQS